MRKTLKDLLLTVQPIKVYGNDGVGVTGISDDSRKVNKGEVFIAIKGLTVDAHIFIDDVINKGASVIVGEVEPKEEWLKKIVYVQVENARKTLSQLASAWYDYPSKNLKVIGVTGTKGKTTVSYLIYELLLAAGKKVGLVSTIKAVIGEKEHDTGLHVTNPEPLELQKFLAEMVKQSCEYAVIEVTSHGLDQERVAGINFYTGVLTNIAPEHLDYHKTFDAYVEAKSKLFENVEIAVLNSDDTSFEKVKTKVPPTAEILTYSAKNVSDYKLKKAKLGKVMELEVLCGSEVKNFNTTLLGEYNAMNCLAAVAVARKEGVDWETIEKTLPEIKPPEGRLEKVENNLGIDIFIDFAHTPDSLENVLTLLKGVTKGKLIAVFGCAGERDTAKRPAMGEISTRLADISVFTAEDPRSEDVNTIIEQIVKGAKKNEASELDVSRISDPVRENKNVFVRIPERGEAIAFAIQKAAQKGDTIVVCGKGHEKSMAYGGVEHPWSDHEEIGFTLNADKNKTVVILAAGRGKRMNSETPKVLEKIAGRPMISYTLENLRKAGFADIIVVVGFKKEMVIKETLGRVKFANQPQMLGTGDAAAKGVAQIKAKNVKDVVIINGDDSAFYNPETINKVISAHRKSKAAVTFVSLNRKDPTGLGRVIRDSRGRLLDIIEEKDADEKQKKITEVNDGLYILDLKWTKANLPEIKKHNSGEYYIVDLVKMALDQERHVEVYKLTNSEEWVGVNTQEDLKVADEVKRKQL